MLLALCPVLAQGWVIGSTAAFDLGEAGQRGGVGLDPLCLPCPACPGAVAPAIACFPPWTALGRVSAFRPGPEPLPRGVSGCLADVLGCTVPVGRRPSPYDGVECLHAVPCRGVLVGVHVGSECPQGCANFCLLWDGQPCALFPALPEVKPQEVHPFLAGHDPGCGCTAGQSSFLKTLRSPWSGIGCQSFPGWGRDHQVIRLAQDRYASLASLATGWGFGASIGVCCVEPPFHPLQGPMRQQWGTHSALWRPRVWRREAARCAHACLQPWAPRGGADRPCGQPWTMVSLVTAAAALRVESPWTALLPIGRRRHGLQRLHRAAPGAQSLGVRLAACLPCRFQGRGNDGLPHPVLSGR